jgi:hypothetical protein
MTPARRAGNPGGSGRVSELRAQRAHFRLDYAGFRNYLMTGAFPGRPGRYDSVASRATFPGGRLHELALRLGNGNYAPGKVQKASIAVFCLDQETPTFVH